MEINTPLQLISVFAFIAQGGLGPIALKGVANNSILPKKYRKKKYYFLLVVYVFCIVFFLIVQLSSRSK